MSKLIINFGSINIDHVYRVPRFVQPGETLTSTDLNTGLGGKGANQSVAIARAGGHVLHFGQLGKADSWALDVMQQTGVDIDYIKLVEQASGHAIIQVDNQGENAILLHGGANQSCDLSVFEKLLDTTKPISYLLLQNECDGLAAAIDMALARDIKVVLNPAPMSASIKTLPLDKLDTLIVNQTEAQALSGCAEAVDSVAYFKRHYPNTRVVLTLGSEGVMLTHQDEQIRLPAYPVSVLDTTGAGDTFVGYLLRALVEDCSNTEALKQASAAAALAVTRSGAIDAIPTQQDVHHFLNA